jgi:hypothetical protein
MNTPSQKLIKKVIKEIQSDVSFDDFTAIDELITVVPFETIKSHIDNGDYFAIANILEREDAERLQNYLPEEEECPECGASMKFAMLDDDVGDGIHEGHECSDNCGYTN